MGLFEATIPKQYRKKFITAVAARRRVNAAYRSGKGNPPMTAINADYKAMNALPLWLQAVADRRAQHLG